MPWPIVGRKQSHVTIFRGSKSMTPVPAAPDGGIPPLNVVVADVGDVAPYQVEWVIGGRAHVLGYWPAPQWDRLPESLRPDDAIPLGDGGWVVLRGRA